MKKPETFEEFKKIVLDIPWAADAGIRAGELWDVMKPQGMKREETERILHRMLCLAPKVRNVSLSESGEDGKEFNVLWENIISALCADHSGDANEMIKGGSMSFEEFNAAIIDAEGDTAAIHALYDRIYHSADASKKVDHSEQALETVDSTQVFPNGCRQSAVMGWKPCAACNGFGKFVWCPKVMQNYEK